MKTFLAISLVIFGFLTTNAQTIPFLHLDCGEIYWYPSQEENDVYYVVRASAGEKFIDFIKTKSSRVNLESYVNRLYSVPNEDPIKNAIRANNGLVSIRVKKCTKDYEFWSEEIQYMTPFRSIPDNPIPFLEKSERENWNFSYGKCLELKKGRYFDILQWGICSVEGYFFIVEVSTGELSFEFKTKASRISLPEYYEKFYQKVSAEKLTNKIKRKDENISVRVKACTKDGCSNWSKSFEY